MGALHLEGVGPIVIDDELLDHVFTVITTKLRRHEPVLLSWIDETGQEQRVFLTHITSIRAEFDTAERTPLAGGLRTAPRTRAARPGRAATGGRPGAVRGSTSAAERLPRLASASCAVNPLPARLPAS